MRNKKKTLIFLLTGSMVAASLMTGCQLENSFSGTTVEQAKGSSTAEEENCISTNSDVEGRAIDETLDMNKSNIDSDSVKATVTGNEGSATNIDTEFTARDLEVGYEETTAVKVTLNGSNITVDGSGATADGGVLTISQEGAYIITGELTDGQIVVDAKDTDKVQIILNGTSLHCENQAPVYIKQADKVFITLQSGTENSMTDGTQYVLSNEDNNVDGVIFSKADLTINGEGTLNITANYKHGIVSKDDLVITGGSITVTANGQGLYGKDCVKIKDGTFELNTQGDAIQSDNTEDKEKGFIYISSGNFTIKSQTDGVQAETVLWIDGGSFNLMTGDGSENASTDRKGDPRSGWGDWGKQESSQTAETVEEPSSAKGLKAGNELIVNGGTITLDSSDDSIHCNGDITIAGGMLELSSGDDGIHADDAFVIQNGVITIKKSYEGLEGQSITVNDGVITVTASDDGLNAAGGSDSSSVNGRPGQNSFEADKEAFIKISGGTMKVNASGDGIDSNGNLYIEGGETYVDGPVNGGNAALDYNGIAEATGGILVAVGSVGMEQSFSDSSAQYSLLHNFDSPIHADTMITITDSDGREVLSYTPEKEWQSAVITAPDLEEGKTYKLTAGNQSAELTLSSVVTSNGSSGMEDGRGGQMHPNEKGQFPQGEKGQKPQDEGMGQPQESPQASKTSDEI